MERAIIVAGLGYGDEGKGATVDALVRHFHVPLVVRYNGGPQAAHNVVTPQGIHHTFSQFGSGSLAGAETLLSRHMLVNPGNMLREAVVLGGKLGIHSGVALEMALVSKLAVIITPFHVEHNRHTACGKNTCGEGVGAARQYQLDFPKESLYAGDLLDVQLKAAKAKLQLMRHRYQYDLDIEKMLTVYNTWSRYVRICDDLEQLARARGTVVFEGAQGVLLDELYGEDGYNTWTDTTFRNADSLLSDSMYVGYRHNLGVLRTYHTRHGDGPFPCEDPSIDFPEPHNRDDGYQGKFRRGSFDSQLLQKALQICGGVGSIALNHLDQRDIQYPLIDYRNVSIGGHGPRATDRTIVTEFFNG